MIVLKTNENNVLVVKNNDLLRAVVICCIVLLIATVPCCSALQNLFPQQFKNPLGIGGGSRSSKAAATEIETKLIDTILQNQDERLSNSEEIISLISELESMYETSSIKNPAISDAIYGKWRLIYTTNTDTSSPIQRKAVDTSKFPIYQDIVVVVDDSDSNNNNNNNNKKLLLVKQIVKFGENAQLSVDALASTAAYPLEELTSERKTTGKVLGLNILGVSLVGEEAEPDPSKPNSRIDFVFDEGYFNFGNNFQLPYPVPFRLPILRDWVKGWIDITWLSPRVRISRGNKGTTFVLLKEEDE